MLTKIISFLQKINNKSGNTMNVSINSSQVITNGDMMSSDELEILGEKLKVDRDFRIEITYNGLIDCIRTSNGNIIANIPESTKTNIQEISSTNGDIEVRGNVDTVDEVSTTNGDITFSKNVTNVGKVKTTNGDINL